MVKAQFINIDLEHAMLKFHILTVSYHPNSIP